MADPKETPSEIDDALGEDQEKRDALEKELARAEREHAPPAHNPDHARDGGTI